MFFRSAMSSLTAWRNFSHARPKKPENGRKFLNRVLTFSTKIWEGEGILGAPPRQLLIKYPPPGLIDRNVHLCKVNSELVLIHVTSTEAIFWFTQCNLVACNKLLFPGFYYTKFVKLCTVRFTISIQFVKVIRGKHLALIDRNCLFVYATYGSALGFTNFQQFHKNISLLISTCIVAKVED